MTQNSSPEFSRPVKLDSIGVTANPVHISADAEERAALARRFALQSIDSLSADYTLTHEGPGIMARGRMRADRRPGRG